MGDDSAEVKQATFSGWAIVEMMGHRKEIGYVTTEAYGQAVMFRVDAPELQEREFVLETPGYANATDEGRRWCPAGTKVRRQASPGKSCLVAASSLYAINPCSEAAAMRAIELTAARPLIILELPPEAERALPAYSDDDRSDDFVGEDDDQ